MGGAWERMVGLWKSALRAVITPGLLTEEEFVTAAVLARELVNRRPLAYVSSDGNDGRVLTPNDFVRPGHELPDYGVVFSDASDYVKRWKHVEETSNRIWRRFIKEVIPQFQRLQKWKGKTRNLREGDVVFYLGERRRGEWPVGRVQAAPKGRDGQVREVQVLITGDELPKRVALQRLALLQPFQ